MIDLGTVTLETFTPQLDSTFTVPRAGAEPAALRLVEADALGEHQLASGRMPFSLTFRESGAHSLAQGIHHLAHETLGELELFIVPIAPDADGALYQAVFA
jgi:hypothetical protein